MNSGLFPFIAGIVMGSLAWAAVLLRYVWPRTREWDLRRVAEPILYVHLFRYVGLAFVMPGVVDHALDGRWAYPAAYGDLASSLLAGVALLLSTGKLFRPSLWLFSIWGTIDLLLAAVAGPTYDIPTHLQATYFLLIVPVPLLLWTHVILYVRLLRSEGPHRASASPALDVPKA